MSFSRFVLSSGDRAAAAETALSRAGFTARMTEWKGAAVLLDVFHSDGRRDEAERLVREVDPTASPVAR